MECREDLLRRAKVLVFPTIPDAERFCYHENLLQGREHIILESEDLNNRYFYYPKNTHHFTTKFTYDNVLPALNTLFNFGYNKDDFYLIENKIVINDVEMDFSYLHPKKHMTFILQYDEFERCMNGVIHSWHHTENLTFDGISSVTNIVNNKFFNESVTKSYYHKLYVAPHQCSILTNTSIDTDKTLFVTCDSQLIPSIPILACYYKKIYIFDNRQYIQQFYLVENEPSPTDVLIQCWCTADDDLYIKQNLQ